MTPMKDVFRVFEDDVLDFTLMRKIANSGHSRIPGAAARGRGRLGPGALSLSRLLLIHGYIRESSHRGPRGSWLPSLSRDEAPSGLSLAWKLQLYTQPPVFVVSLFRFVLPAPLPSQCGTSSRPLPTTRCLLQFRVVPPSSETIRFKGYGRTRLAPPVHMHISFSAPPRLFTVMKQETVRLHQRRTCSHVPADERVHQHVLERVLSPVKGFTPTLNPHPVTTSPLLPYSQF